MKLLVTLLLIIFFSLHGAFAQNKAEGLPMDSTCKYPQISFAQMKYDFGKVRKGEKVTTAFHFKNTGLQPLKILQVQTTCGCTITEWSKKPIAPNTTGEISVVFDTTVKDMVGKQTKTVLVITNAKNKEVLLTLEGEILNE
jgi:hypothetical protein